MNIADPGSRGFDAGRLAAIDAMLRERYVDSGRPPPSSIRSNGITMVFMTQLGPSSLHPIRRKLKTMICAALA